MPKVWTMMAAVRSSKHKPPKLTLMMALLSFLLVLSPYIKDLSGQHIPQGSHKA